jgi:hypothetical protein
MSVWSTIVTDLESVLNTIKTQVETDVGIIWSDLKLIISTDAQTLYNDFGPMLQQIAVNIQNTQPGISLSNFLPAFIAAIEPVIVQEGLKLLDTDKNIIANSFASKVGVASVQGNAGVVTT